ncbi:MAG: glutaredoxin family protein [Patescibacteria group bacterium]
MDDTALNQTNQQATMPPTTPAPMPNDNLVPVDPALQQAPAPAAVDPAVAPVAPVAPTMDDLQKITQDLQNLAQEVAAPAVAPVAPVAAPASMPSAPVETKTPSSIKATVYVITDCPYCKAEKDFLASRGVAFVEKNVETDEASLKEMLSLSDNFAGVPVTVLEGTDGKKIVVKGFTQTDFEEEMKKVSGEAPKTAPVPPAQEPAVTQAPTQQVAPAVPPATPQIPNLN